MLNKLKNVNWTKNMFLVPILLVAGISISHVVSWYEMANPYNWAIYLSIAIEVGAMTSLIAATKKIKGGVWFMFGLVTFIQMLGNIFYSYVQIDANGDLFKNWVELMSPIFEMMGTDVGDVIPHKRWLALLEGGFLPLISLTALHFYIKYDDSEGKTPEVEPPQPSDEPNDVEGLPMDSLIGQEPTISVQPNNEPIGPLVTEEETEEVLPPPHLSENFIKEIDLFNEQKEKVVDKIVSEEHKATKEISEEEVERQKHLKFRKRITDEEIDEKSDIIPKRDKITQKIIK